jgi:hypothetical protein
MTPGAQEKRPARDWLSLILLVLICAVLIQQTRFLFVYPVPDTGMWFGDESWTMLTARALASTGVAHIPEAVGSSLAHSNGLVNGSVWLTGFLYGTPAHIFESIATPVEIGREISLILCVVTLALAYRLGHRLTSNRFTSLLAIVVLVASDAFAFSSHCARFDAATGLATLAYLTFLQHTYEHRNDLNQLTAFLITFLACLSLAVYVHVPTLIALPAFYTLWRIRIWKHRQLLLATILGAVAAYILIAGAYWLSTSSVDLLGKGYNQYYNVANSLPIMHPFSWQVQKINTIDRALQVWDVAWPLAVVILTGIIIAVLNWRHVGLPSRFWLWLTFFTLIGWCAFEGPAVFYNIHVLPVLAVSSVVLIATLNAQSWRIATTVFAIVVSIVAITRQEHRGKVGSQLTHENSLASFISPALGSRIMVDEPALNEVAYLEHTPAHIQLATKHFLLFGGEQKAPSDILRDNNVNYLLLYSTVRYQSQLRAIADSFYAIVARRTGHLTDQARSYDDPNWGEFDTMRLYKRKQ